MPVSTIASVAARNNAARKPGGVVEPVERAAHHGCAHAFGAPGARYIAR